MRGSYPRQDHKQLWLVRSAKPRDRRVGGASARTGGPPQRTL